MKKGRVKFFNEAKGFGFIVDDDSRQEIFFHISGISGSEISKDDHVSYNVQQGKKGPIAVNITRIS